MSPTTPITDFVSCCSQSLLGSQRLTTNAARTSEKSSAQGEAGHLRAEYVAGKIEPANDCAQHPLAHVSPFVKRQRKRLRASINVGMVNHPLRTLAAPYVKLKSCIVVMQN